jgi:16S rRNA (guanine(966)-N(2))-methyltransferase RsmD
MIQPGQHMRIIAGTYKGRRLKTLAGPTTRPTSDRLRETLFNILAPWLDGSRFLDVCAGSGAAGIEALSRGASEVTFIEQALDACSVIETNLNTLGASVRATIQCREALAGLRALEGASKQFDIAFFDPPYSSEIYGHVIKQLGSGNLIAPGGVVVVEHRVKIPTQPEYGKLHRFRELKQGESALAFYEFRDSRD